MKITFISPSDFIEFKDSIEPNGDRKSIEIYEDGTTIETVITKTGKKTISSNRIWSVTQAGNDVEILITNTPDN